MSTEPITTEDRIFIRRFLADVNQRERIGAGLLSPGALATGARSLRHGHEQERQPGTCRQSICN